MVKCPYCGGMINENNYCHHCQKEFTMEEIQNIKDAEMINDDMKVYVKVMKFKGRS